MMSVFFQQKAHLKSLTAFLLVGGISALINFCSFIFFWKYGQINYPIAVSIAYALSVLFHFTANRYFTFKSHTARMGRQISKYAVMVLINYLMTLVVIHYVVAVLNFSPYVGSASAIAATVGIGYILSRFWVFHPNDNLDMFQGG